MRTKVFVLAALILFGLSSFTDAWLNSNATSMATFSITTLSSLNVPNQRFHLTFPNDSTSTRFLNFSAIGGAMENVSIGYVYSNGTEIALNTSGTAAAYWENFGYSIASTKYADLW